MSYIDTKNKPVEEIVREQYPYIEDFSFTEKGGVLSITCSRDISESLERLMRYIAPDTSYVFEEKS